MGGAFHGLVAVAAVHAQLARVNGVAVELKMGTDFSTSPIEFVKTNSCGELEAAGWGSWVAGLVE